MNRNVMLTVTALLSNLFLTLHLADDIVMGDSRGLTNFTAIAVFLVYLIGTLLLRERKSGYVIMFFGGLISVGMPFLHMSGNGIGPKRGFFFIWGLLVLGTLGLFSAILAADGFWRLQRGRRQ